MEKNLSFFDRLKLLENYFKRNIENNPFFEPEYKAMKEMNTYLQKEKIQVDEIHKVIAIFNNTSLGLHYNGTAWFDLKLHLRSFLHANEIPFKENADNTLVILE